MPNGQPVKEIYRRRTGELIEKITDNGVLELTMKDMRPTTNFETASVHDIKYSVDPIHRAGLVLLFYEGMCRVLKTRTALLIPNKNNNWVVFDVRR